MCLGQSLPAVGIFRRKSTDDCRMCTAKDVGT
jgi:hypothetical protein